MRTVCTNNSFHRSADGNITGMACIIRLSSAWDDHDPRAWKRGMKNLDICYGLIQKAIKAGELPDGTRIVEFEALPDGSGNLSIQRKYFTVLLPGDFLELKHQGTDLQAMIDGVLKKANFNITLQGQHDSNIARV